MAHPAKPDDHAHLRSVLQRMKSDSWSGWHGNDRPYVDAEGKGVEEALNELRRRTERRLEEHEKRQFFTKPSRQRREARQRAEHRIQKGDTTW